MAKITNKSFKRLLEALSVDEAEAGATYTKLRDSLVRFFQIKGDSEPETAADETLDRVAVKFSNNPEIDDLTKYSFGVARLIFLERIKSRQKEKKAADGFYTEKVFMKSDDDTDDFLPFRECFAKLTDREKTLLQKYFADVSPAKLTEQREQLTVEQNISANNLRLKIHRLRQRLENCVKRRLGK